MTRYQVRGFEEDRIRVFCGVFPTGLVWADRWHEVDGDYKRLAYLNFSTLVLEFEKDCPEELMAAIRESAEAMQKRKGERFEVSACGQTVILGDAGTRREY